MTRKQRSDKNKRRSIDKSLIDYVEALALHKPKLSITTIHRKTSQLAKKQNNSSPTYSVVYDIVSKINPALLTLAQEGSVAYRNKYELIFRRECNVANEMWQMDHCLLDILLLDEKNQKKKPWLTIIIDDYSRAICGFFLSFGYPCAINTALALRQAIWRKSNPDWQVCGIPEILYTDNGSDFISEHIEKVCASLKIRMVNSIPGRPQGKGRVERFFLTLLQSVLETLPGYAPQGLASATKATLTLAQFSSFIETFILEQYHQTAHSVTGQAPIRRWLGQGFLPQMPTSLEQLDLLLLTVPTLRKVHRDGIYFKGFRYMNTILSAFIGEQVTVRYDPRDIAEIRIFYKGEFICNAICQDIADQIISLKEIKSIRQKHKGQHRKTINEAKQLLQNVENNTTGSSAAIKNGTPTKKKRRLKLYKNE